MNNIIKRKWNQNSMVIIEDLQGMAFQAESGGHTFQISGIDGEGNAVALSGTPAGVMLRADGQDVTLTCSASEGVISATLPANAYSVPGRFGLTIFLTSDGQKTAIYAAVGTVGKTSSGTVAPPAGSDVVTLVNQINTAIAAIPANYNACFAPAYSTSGLYSVGQYVTYNGNLYRCNTAITTAETWTAAHWTQTNLGADVYDLKSALSDEVQHDTDLYYWLGEEIASQVNFNPNLNDGLWLNRFVENGNITYSVPNYACTKNLIPVKAGGTLKIDKSSIPNYSNLFVFWFEGTTYISSANFWSGIITVPSGITNARLLISFSQNTSAKTLPLFDINIDPSKTSREYISDLYGDIFSVNTLQALKNVYPFADGFYSHRVIPSGTSLGFNFGYADVTTIRFDITGVSEINASFTELYGHGTYAITDDSGTVLASKVATGDSVYTGKFNKANLPSGAKYIYFCALTTSIESATFSIRWDDRGATHQSELLTNIQNETLWHEKQLTDYTVWDYVWANTGSWVRFTNNNSFIYNVRNIDTVFVTLKRPENNYFAYLCIIYEDGTIKRFVESGGEASITRKFTLPENSKYLVVFHYKAQAANTVSVTAYARNNSVNNAALSDNTEKLYGHWAGKDFVWFGTSIPAGATGNKYPQMIGDILDVNVYNEAVGSSPAHCRQKNLVSESNPYGFISNFSASSRCLSNTTEEMQWIVDNWNSGVFTEELPSDMTEELAASILANSYETKLLKYFDQTQFYRVPELIVMNHGYNDKMDYEETDYKIPFAISHGEAIDNGYQYHEGEDTPRTVGGAYRLEFDVTGIDSVEINSVCGKYLDVWDLFSGVTLIQSGGMQYSSGKTKTVIKVGSATKLVLTIPNGVSTDEISVFDYAYFTDRFTYNGAMNFLFVQIKSRCPKARIVMIGEYADETRELVALNQKKVADRWDIPLYDQWNMLQFSANYIWTTYGWSNGEFVKNAYPNGHYMKEINMYLQDGVHPHTDGTKQVTKYMAQNMAKWIDGIYAFEYNQ